jgi:hypothetical protein
MIDREVARLRRLRGEALRVREIARALGASAWAKGDVSLARGACASWRVARLVSGKLQAHPYLRYQRGAGIGSLLFNRAVANYLALVRTNRLQGLKEFEARLQALTRQLDDARALTHSTDFSHSLGRSQAEIKSLIESLAEHTQSALPGRPAGKGAARNRLGDSGSVGDLAPSLERDWPYLAF